jgi:hypothetical protein
MAIVMPTSSLELSIDACADVTRPPLTNALKIAGVMIIAMPPGTPKASMAAMAPNRSAGREDRAPASLPTSASDNSASAMHRLLYVIMIIYFFDINIVMFHELE